MHTTLLSYVAVLCAYQFTLTYPRVSDSSYGIQMTLQLARHEAPTSAAKDQEEHNLATLKTSLRKVKTRFVQDQPERI